MREVILLLTVIAATLVVASGAALAVTTQGGPGNDVVLGTDGSDYLGAGSAATPSSAQVARTSCGAAICPRARGQILHFLHPRRDPTTTIS
jgi:hypothetical protein